MALIGRTSLRDGAQFIGCFLCRHCIVRVAGQDSLPTQEQGSSRVERRGGEFLRVLSGCNGAISRAIKDDTWSDA